MKKLLAVLFLLALSGCAPIVKDGQPTAAVTDFALQAGQTIGQTFLARDDGLQGVEIYLRPGGKIKLHLRASSQAETDLAVAKLPAQNGGEARWLRFDFPTQNNSRQKDYYFFLEQEGKNSALIATAPGGSYPDGALYQNGTPLDAQMTFRLVYQTRPFFIGLLAQMLNWGVILAIGIFLFILPGWALLMAFWPGWSLFAPGEKLGLAGGLSLALYPLLFLWTNLAGLHLGALYAWLPGLAGLAFIIWRCAVAWKVKKFQIPNLQLLTWNQSLPDLLLFALLALIVFTRFWVIRSLDLPMWGDSYQHTMIAQLLVDHGGLFNSWQPYAELQTFTYHFGFHTAVAVFHWVSGQNLAQATLWAGQIINILAVLAVYPLAMRVAGNRWAGVGAVLVAGLLSPMPMYYVNWGRYTQLAGQVILPGAICLAWAALENLIDSVSSPSQKSWRNWLPLRLAPLTLLWLLWGGLALTHFRVLIFGVLFFAAFFALNGKKNNWKFLLTKIFWLGAGAGLLFLPWFLHTFAGGIIRNLSAQLTTPAQAVALSTQQYNAIGDLTSYLPLFLWLLLPISLLWGLLRREKSVALIGLWWSFILLAANPQWLRLPGEGALSNFAVFIAAYLPVSVLMGYLLREIIGGAAKVAGAEKTFAPNLLFFACLVAIAFWGLPPRLNDFQPTPHALATRPDIRAAAWIRENTPSSARFLVNSMFAYGDTVIVGTDGGWWLPLLAQRQTSLPPLNYGSERGPRPDYGAWINLLTSEIQTKGITHADVLALLRQRAITHVYIGQNQGRINYGGPLVLEPVKLLESASFHLIYHQDRVWIFEMRGEQ
ncbi:MAG: hypothetical protein OHK0031_07410 [Anaerolineales bacterium]